jgi:hypothetical protein
LGKGKALLKKAPPLPHPSPPFHSLLFSPHILAPSKSTTPIIGFVQLLSSLTGNHPTPNPSPSPIQWPKRQLAKREVKWRRAAAAMGLGRAKSNSQFGGRKVEDKRGRKNCWMGNVGGMRVPLHISAFSSPHSLHRAGSNHP